VIAKPSSNVPIKALENMKDALYQFGQISQVVKELKDKSGLDHVTVHKSTATDSNRIYVTKQESIASANSQLKAAIEKLKQKTQEEVQFSQEMDQLSREWLIHKVSGKWSVNGVILERQKGNLIVPLRDSVQEALDESLYGKKVEKKKESDHFVFCQRLIKNLNEKTGELFVLYQLENNVALLKSAGFPVNIVVRGSRISYGSITVGQADLLDLLTSE
jgi:hypothetical protein